ncbi:MAG: FAD-binding protein [Methanobacteriota archaeon]|nr:MAG: FAD-binding protein [Euryarchaeota archaeon]
MDAETLSSKERHTLRVLADTLVPSLAVSPDSDGFYGRKASDLAVDEDVARIIERYLSPEQRADFRRLLRTVESPMANLLLSGTPRRFSTESEANRERFLLGWAHSRLGIKRQGFHAVKRLVLFLTYAKVLDGGVNPNWPSIGYAGPPSAESPLARHPSEVRIEPLKPTGETALDADVCVVGSGAGGSVIAAKLAEAGYRVIVLEAGSYRTAATFRQREAEAYDTMFQGHGVLTTTDLAFSVLAGQTAGGSSTINWMTCLKPPRWAREEWEREAGMTGVASPAFDSFIDEVWSRLHVNVEESVVNPSNDVLRRGSEALGYRFGIDYDVIPRNAHGCGSRCDFCFFGCVYDAKQSSLVTYLPDANRAGARFLFDTKADHLIIQSGEVRGVEATFRNGAHSIPVHVRARTVVAAGSAIQTPALLLRSGIRSSGVGLGLRLDPTTALFGEFAAPIRMWSGPMQTIVVHRFQGSEEGHHGPWLESAPGHPGLSALAIPWSGGRAHKDAMRRLDRAASTIVLVRDVAEGRVTIDARGEPLLQYHLSSRDRRNLTHGLQEAARILRAAGALRMGSLHLRECSVGDGREPIRGAEFDAFIDRMGRLGIRENGVALFSAHPMGSARAGTDPRTSAAKPTGESHDVRNLWIGDGSLLPTAPGVNPMISIMALAARTAGFIRERLSRRG